MISSLDLDACISFFALIMSILSIWVKRSPMIWGSFLAIACVEAYFSKILEPIGLAPIAALFVLHGLLKTRRGWFRFLLILVTAAISIGLWFHLFPGFNNWLVLDKVSIGHNAAPLTLYFNFDKPFVGFFILVWGLPLIQTAAGFKDLFKVTIPISILGIAFMATLALFTGLIDWDPKFPPFFWIFAIDNLFLVAIAEEVFLRGFIQNECYRFMGGKSVLASIGAVLITSILFTLLHVKWVASVPFLGLVFVASLIYGAIYQWTKAIEASILCHFLFNITHFLLFTYPVLQSAMA